MKEFLEMFIFIIINLLMVLGNRSYMVFSFIGFNKCLDILMCGEVYLLFFF